MMLTKEQAENCLTLIEVLEDIKAEEYDASTVYFTASACCAIGHARKNGELFHRQNTNFVATGDFGDRFDSEVFDPKVGIPAAIDCHIIPK